MVSIYDAIQLMFNFGLFIIQFIGLIIVIIKLIVKK